jgi:steroid 5-alpha reductase family enzyme
MNTDVWLYGFLAAMVIYQVAAIPALILKKNDLADVTWGPAFPLSAAAAILFGAGGFSNLDTRSLIIFVLIALWGLRLFIHVGRRSLSTRQEDVRYHNWRLQWGTNQVWRSYLQVFVLQPLILYIILTPVLLSVASPSEPLGVAAQIGIAAWALGFFFETISDEQLRRHKLDPANKGRLMTSGLWSWSRHPNYFGEVLQWWGVWLMVTEIPYGWATLVSPLMMTFMILKVSGVSMLEDLMRDRPGFADYARRTSIFFPRPPKV